MRPKTAKPKASSNEYAKEIQFLQQQKLVALGGDLNNLPPIFQKNPAFLVLETELQAELFNARCHDTGETVSIERAKIFKEEFNKINSKKHPDTLNLYSMRLGVTTVIALANQKPNFANINLSDNTLGDYAIHAIRTLLNNIPARSLGLASNMISHIGLSQIIEDLCKNQTLRALDLGVLEGSIRKNALGIEGAKLIAQLILSNKNIETLKLSDNDFTPAGGEFIGTALKNNKIIRNLKVAENDLKNSGIEKILEYGMLLESLDLSRNNIKACEKFLRYIQGNRNLKRLNLEYNELGPKGVEYIAQGIIYQQGGLVSLNLRGNGIRDRGLEILAEAINDSETLEELDIALNDLTPEGIQFLARILPDSQLKVLNLSRNLLGDESLIMLCNNRSLEKLDVSTSKISDKGFIHFIEYITDSPKFMSLRANDNYISEKVEKVLLEILEKNKTVQEISVNGNRLSLCCLSRIQKVLQRNQKLLEEKEPNQIRTEIYRLKYEQKKILMAKEKLNHQEQEIRQIEEAKYKVIAEMEKIKQQEQAKRQAFQDRINDHNKLIEAKRKVIDEKTQEFERTKVKKLEEIEVLKVEFEVQFQKRRELECEYEKLQKELDAQEQKFKDEQERLTESIAEKKKKTEEVEKQTNALREELAKLQKPQLEVPGPGEGQQPAEQQQMGEQQNQEQGAEGQQEQQKKDRQQQQQKPKPKPKNKGRKK